jgi:hypothetical protein
MGKRDQRFRAKGAAAWNGTKRVAQKDKKSGQLKWKRIASRVHTKRSPSPYSSDDTTGDDSDDTASVSSTSSYASDDDSDHGHTGSPPPPRNTARHTIGKQTRSAFQRAMKRVRPAVDRVRTTAKQGLKRARPVVDRVRTTAKQGLKRMHTIGSRSKTAAQRGLGRMRPMVPTDRRQLKQLRRSSHPHYLM